jgi:hypothetical protein
MNQMGSDKGRSEDNKEKPMYDGQDFTEGP